MGLRKQILYEIQILIKKGLNHLVAFSVVAVITSFLFGPAMVILGLYLNQKYNENNGSGLLILGVVFCIVFLAAVIEITLRLLKKKKILQLIKEDIENVVWVFIESRKGEVTNVPIKGEFKIGHFYHFHLMFIDGKRSPLLLSWKDCQKLWYLMGDNLPRLSMGWHDDFMKTWEERPSLLRDEVKRVGTVKSTLIKTKVR